MFVLHMRMKQAKAAKAKGWEDCDLHMCKAASHLQVLSRGSQLPLGPGLFPQKKLA